MVSVSSASESEISFLNIPELRTSIIFLSEEILTCKDGATGKQRVGTEMPEENILCNILRQNKFIMSCLPGSPSATH